MGGKLHPISGPSRDRPRRQQIRQLRPAVPSSRDRANHLEECRPSPRKVRRGKWSTAVHFGAVPSTRPAPAPCRPDRLKDVLAQHGNNVRDGAAERPHRFRRAIVRRALWMAEDAARELPNLSLEDALQLVHLYGDLESPKYERAALRWLERYLAEGSPRLEHFAEVAMKLARDRYVASDPAARDEPSLFRVEHSTCDRAPARAHRLREGGAARGAPAAREGDRRGGSPRASVQRQRPPEPGPKPKPPPPIRICRKCRELKPAAEYGTGRATCRTCRRRQTQASEARRHAAPLEHEAALRGERGERARQIALGSAVRV